MIFILLDTFSYTLVNVYIAYFVQRYVNCLFIFFTPQKALF